MESATEFDKVNAIVLTKPVSALAVGTADPVGHKSWVTLDTARSGAGTVVIRFADGTEKTLASVMLPVPKSKQQNRIHVRVSLSAVDETSVAVEPKAVESKVLDG